MCDICKLVGIVLFIVISGVDFYLGVIDDYGGWFIDDGGVWIVGEVVGY